ncbi:MAG TPA: hypothetical protein VLH09_05020 [Bryobacteraceae bacterium]|nr:hypothetical protein [Bryobacteraceae bacterium]
MRLALKCAIVLAGLLAVDVATSGSRREAAPDYGDDPRLLKLEHFFGRLQSPAHSIAKEFLLAADKHGLDWRLLPSLSILESGGGKACRNNNILGWDSCRKAFPSDAAGVHYVAERLSVSSLYRSKSLNEKLRTYNPHGDYPQRVRSLMRRLGPDRDVDTSLP